MSKVSSQASAETLRQRSTRVMRTSFFPFVFFLFGFSFAEYAAPSPILSRVMGISALFAPPCMPPFAPRLLYGFQSLSCPSLLLFFSLNSFNTRIFSNLVEGGRAKAISAKDLAYMGSLVSCIPGPWSHLSEKDLRGSWLVDVKHVIRYEQKRNFVYMAWDQSRHEVDLIVCILSLALIVSIIRYCFY